MKKGPEVPTRVWLVGLSGAGKSEVGPELARRLGYEFIDLDEMIEGRAGATISELFRTDGESRFRELEASASCEAGSRMRVVVATGGGWMARRDLERSWPDCVRVWLRVSPGTANHRLSGQGKHDRPLLAGEDPAGTLSGMLSEREEAYARAEIAIDTEGREPDEVVVAIVEQIRAWALPSAPTQESRRNS